MPLSSDFAAYEGWPLVPVRARDKRPIHSDFLKRTFQPSDFSDGCNVGVKLGCAPLHLVDLDLDCPEAVIAAGILAPQTRMSGRASKPRSHYWFSCPGFEPKVFTGLPTQTGTAGKVLLELRSTGGQTVIPPSVHESGEAVTWENAHAPILTQTSDELAALGAKIAIATLIGRHWPGSGRHYLSGPLGGLLARLGLLVLDVEYLVRAVCAIAHDGEVDDRVRFARESVEKHAQGVKTTGGKTFADLLVDGDALVRTICRWLGKDGDDRIDALNTIHFVTRIGKDMVVGTEEDDQVLFQTFADFEKVYYNQFIGKARLSHKWLEHPNRRTYGKAQFAPPGSVVKVGPTDYNLWRGFAATPLADANPEPYLQRYLEHIGEVVADGHPLHREFVLDLLADTVQRPGDPVGKALALRSPQGLGKSVFVEAFGKLFGRHFLCVSSRQQITGQFNGHLSGKIVLFADEAIWGGNKTDIGVLKHMVTQRTIPIQYKGIDIMPQPNYLHLFLATNEDWAWPAGNLERRGVVLDLQKRKPAAYFDKLWAEVQAPSFAPALLAFLLHRQVDLPRLRQGLDTEGLREQKELTASIAQQWWKMVLTEGGWAPSFSWSPVVSLYTLYAQFCEDMGSPRGAGQSHRGSKSQFSKALMAMVPTARIERRKTTVNLGLGPRPNYVKTVTPCLVLPNLEGCRSLYDQITGSAHSWPVITEQPTLPSDEEGDL